MKQLNMKPLLSAVQDEQRRMQAVRQAMFAHALAITDGITIQQVCQQQQSGVETLAGTRLYITATAPATFDQAGYLDTDIVWTLIGEVTDPGSHGKHFNEVVHKPIASRGEKVFKGGYTAGSKTVQLGLDRDDSGQTLCKTARDSDSDYYFKQVYQGGDIDFFAGKIMSFDVQGGGVDTIRAATMMVRLVTNSAGVDIVEYNAP